ncbi:peptide deformylase [Candidatus Methylacidiphilum infernorum]|uniref:Peptide deformylase n=1 Tax=Methylacidiphilum infernorum (isolate V4) TaxID=481448 RepID=DEF_METI4|nr:peptide deformylase [Candidatus Methylacidiphilum infernorum]B3DUG9.1 RecName: Full=Peptide deformylase; Short=PDF; AltName: Full=Polypeptide deformylase [Methylacidiphilum infernorum V4]ACD82972.1 N-formylmethionyl-tRNA deformylase [Methylacidiphilum infernorum V4]
MILKLVLYDNPILRKKGMPIDSFDDRLKRLVQDMLETMAYYKGVGLAAQQVGLNLQLAVIDVSGSKLSSSLLIGGKPAMVEEHMPLFLINPTLSYTQSKEISNEGCLSFPGLRIDVPRSKRVKVKTFDLEGRPWYFEAGGFLSVAIQHEFDHLQGKLFIDYLSAEQKKAIKEELEKIKRGEAILSVKETD